LGAGFKLFLVEVEEQADPTFQEQATFVKPIQVYTIIFEFVWKLSLLLIVHQLSQKLKESE
jgi:hypothetical protein